ncbi:MAG: HupE/UreJ family protein [Rhodobacteraceae bacterium]|nr:HupE/UreJ family protein [Paracoccaceae bacterium]
MATPEQLLTKVFRLVAMSMVALVTMLWAVSASAHETQPSIANVAVGDRLFEGDLTFNAEALLAGIDLGVYSDTNDAPQAEEYDRLRALPGDQLQEMINAEWPRIRESFQSEGMGELELNGVEVSVQENLELTRQTAIFLSAPVEADAEGVRIGWAAENGTLILRQSREGETYAALLQDGEVSELLPKTGVVDETAGEAFWRFLVAGFEHIIPLGVDHILFVLGLFFFALKWSPILWQVTAFTVAHTVTLALATLGIINIPDEWMWLVEAIIALSITWVAIENILQPRMGWLRPAIVFVFGLLHGLGFASVLSDFGLSQGQFVVSLIAFNVGVEIGQLTVILSAFVLIMVAVWAARVGRLDDPEEAMVRDLPEMYRANAIVGSILIGLVGAYWFVERAFF